MLFVDGHVHIHDCFDAGLLFDWAWKNFQAAAGLHGGSGQAASCLLLAERETENWFHTFSVEAGKDSLKEKDISAGWRGRYCEEDPAVLVFNPAEPEQKMYVVPGRQVMTAERIEVLGLFCTAAVKDGMTLAETVSSVRQSGAVPVLPWGVGKWIGGRGKMIESLVREHGEDLLYVGDNGGRPWFWPTPAVFQMAVRHGVQILPGTDPLPLADEVKRIGSFGFCVKAELPDSESPVAYLRRLLLSGKISMQSYGGLLGAGRFLNNQLRLRLKG